MNRCREDHRIWTVFDSLGLLCSQLSVDTINTFSSVCKYENCMVFFVCFSAKTEPPIILSVNPICNRMFQIQWKPREKTRGFPLVCMLRFRTVNSSRWVSYPSVVFPLETQGRDLLTTSVHPELSFSLFTWKMKKILMVTILFPPFSFVSFSMGVHSTVYVLYSEHNDTLKN